jgi:hypothetical protein
MFKKYLLRSADDGGKEFYADLLSAGVREEAVIAGIMSSDEYFAKQGY